MTRRLESSAAFRTWASLASVWTGDAAIVIAEQAGPLADGALRVVAANPAFESDVGYTDTTLPGLPFTHFQPPGQADLGWFALARAIRGGGPVSMRLSTRFADGRVRRLAWAFLPAPTREATLWLCRVFPAGTDPSPAMAPSTGGVGASLRAIVAGIDDKVRSVLLPAYRRLRRPAASGVADELPAIRSALRGMLDLRREIAQRARDADRAPRARERGTDPAPFECNGAIATLTPRELEVLRLIGAGLSRRQIAARLHRSAKTVDVHQASILRKLGLGSRTALIRFAMGLGLVAS